MNRYYSSLALVAVPVLILLLNSQRRKKPIAGKITKTVVIVGGSYAGIGVAQGLLKQLPHNVKVILINPSDLFFFNIASPRIIAKPDAFAQEKYLFSIPELFAKQPSDRFELVLGKATAIDSDGKSVTVVESNTNGSSAPPRPIAYDYLVIASGSTTQSTIGSDSLNVPFKPTGDNDKLLSQIKAAQATLKDANSVIIGGAGPVGVEFAGELAEAFAAHKKQNTQITIVSATEMVLPGIKPAGQARAQKFLTSLGVKIIAGAKVLQSAEDAATKKWTVTLSTGETLTADAYVSAIGVLPNNDFIPPSFLNDNGFVPVDGQCRVRTATGNTIANDIYALGDITHHPYRVVSLLPTQISAVVTNLKSDILGSGKRVTDYDQTKQMFVMIVPVGQSQGTGQFGWWTPPSFLVSFVKGRDFLTSRAKGMVS
jgi:NADH dehydrogenase FAD-containing subunit